jgi:Gram-negative bacterial TonB protein C-terminal
MISLVVLASWGYVTPMPLHVAVAPLPPPAPEPPAQVTDARVFPHAWSLYSSLPLRMPVEGDTFRLYVTDGVGINFLSLPDIGATYRQGNTEWRVWPGQALEGLIVRRVLPQYLRAVKTRGAVSVFLEYLITTDGSVKVLRTSGPTPFTNAAQSAIEHWVYRPLEFENRPCEVVSRVEVRFDSEFAQSGTSR